MSRMDTRARFGSIGILGAVLVGTGCSSAPPAEPKEPGGAQAEATAKPAGTAEAEIPKEPVDSGMACAKAEAQCGGGVCAVTMNNTCDNAVTCEFAMLTVCQAQTDLVQAKAKRRETFAAKTKAQVSIAADCAAGQIVSTKVQSLACK